MGFHLKDYKKEEKPDRKRVEEEKSEGIIAANKTMVIHNLNVSQESVRSEIRLT